MSRLLLYTDLSPSRVWLFATIHENRALLEQHNIVLAPFYPWISDTPKAHYQFWAEREESAPLPQWFNNALLQVGKDLDNGRDVLVFGIARTAKAHQTLHRLVQPLLDKGGHQCHSLFICGRPTCLLEQRWQTVTAKATLATKIGIVRQHASIAALIRHNQQLWGSENISLLADFSESIHAIPQPHLAEALFNWLQCPPPVLPQHTVEHPFLFASWPARRLFAARKVRYNVWPSMDTGTYLDTLKVVEVRWPRCLKTPLKYRAILLNEGEQDLRELEIMCHAPHSSLACPPWLETEQENEPGLVLAPEYANAFAQALPQAVCMPLMQRLGNDAPLLSQNHKLLATALNETKHDFSHVGEPVPPPTLTVLTMTYNQEKYIADCMDSVLAQKTDFPVQHIVLDHNSDDATPRIVAEYAAQHASIKPVLLSHHIAQENTRGLFLRCRSTYASLCDGDDYFTDPLKLQKQVDYLEKNQDCALCAHPVRVIYEDNDATEYIYPPDDLLPKGPNAKYDIGHLLQGNMIQTNSVVYRWRFVNGLPQWFRTNICPGDWYWHLLHAEMGNIGFVPEVMSVYRRHKKALYHTTQISVMEHRKKHGMAELATYHAVNEHFQGKYFEDLASLADGVFVNFLELSMDENLQTLLNTATEKFPEFARHFLQSMKNVSNTTTQELPDVP